LGENVITKPSIAAGNIFDITCVKDQRTFLFMISNTLLGQMLSFPKTGRHVNLKTSPTNPNGAAIRNYLDQRNQNQVPVFRIVFYPADRRSKMPDKS
jgi:hypothetical protein